MHPFEARHFKEVEEGTPSVPFLGACVSLDSLHTLMRYKRWADARLFDALAELPEEVLAAERKIVFGSILRTLNHVYSMDAVWRAHLVGEPHGMDTRNPKTCPPFAQIRAVQHDMDEWYIRYAGDLTPDQSEETIDFTFIGGGPGTMTRRDMLLHVVNHTTYHRGHIGDLLYEIDVEPPTTDYPVFLHAADA